MDSTNNYFKLKQLTRFADLDKDPNLTLMESDLCFQNQEFIAQFEHINNEDTSKEKILPGIFTMTQDANRIALKKTEPKRRVLLTSVMNTQAILQEANTFFKKLDVYEELGLPKKRGVLLYSAPGLGKSAAISQFIQDSSKTDPGTVVMLWPTSEIDASDVAKFLSVQSEFSPECTRLVLIIEDIGGSVHEGHHGPRQTDSAMLNLLDGVNVIFSVPTFIIATTNFPENLLSSLANRPGRFDKFIELKPPAYAERIQLLEFIAKRELTPEEKVVFKNKDADELSIAHLEEIVVRSRLHDKTLMATLKEMTDHIKNFKKSFGTEQGGLGF